MNSLLTDRSLAHLQFGPRLLLSAALALILPLLYPSGPLLTCGSSGSEAALSAHRAERCAEPVRSQLTPQASPLGEQEVSSRKHHSYLHGLSDPFNAHHNHHKRRRRNQQQHHHYHHLKRHLKKRKHEIEPLSSTAETHENRLNSKSRSPSSSVLSSYKRRAVDLAVNRLHILESLDGQLREFAALAAISSDRARAGARAVNNNNKSVDNEWPRSRRNRHLLNVNNNQLDDDDASELIHLNNDDRHHDTKIDAAENDEEDLLSPSLSSSSSNQQQLVCQLKLNFGNQHLSELMAAQVNRSSQLDGTKNNSPASICQSDNNQLPDCLADPLLKRHVPPYMLNLHRQLVSESRKLADAVQLMPYKSLIMRSFAQPAATIAVADKTRLFRRHRNQRKRQQQQQRRRKLHRSQLRQDREMLSAGAQRDHVVEAMEHEIWRDRAGGRRDDYNGLTERQKFELESEQEQKQKRLKLGSARDLADLADRQPSRSALSLNVVVQLSALQVSEGALAYHQEQYIGGDLNDRQRRLRQDSTRSYQLDEQLAPAANSFAEDVHNNNNADDDDDDDDSSSSLATKELLERAVDHQLFEEQEHEQLSRWIVEQPDELQVAACDLGQRLLAAHDRHDLCYWFQISDQLRAKINGSFSEPLTLAAAAAAGQQHPSRLQSNKRPSEKETASSRAFVQPQAVSERLVEAELHLFKLLPEVWMATNNPDRESAASSATNEANLQQQQQQHQSKSALTPAGDVFGQKLPGGYKNGEPLLEKDDSKNTSNSSGSSRTASNIYQLKTNLLEVSLYQILPKRRTLTNKTSSLANCSSDQTKDGSNQEDEFPLRLLDIRRIDLYSSGWETFYVKAAVLDWIKDANSNLGLVIKAKSMFEEPIRIGLIRFADLYDHRAPPLPPPPPPSRSTDHSNAKRQTSESDGPKLMEVSAQEEPVKGLVMEMGVNGQQQQQQAPPMRQARIHRITNERQPISAMISAGRPVEHADAESAMGFDLSHQPILVIYTTAASS